MDPADKVALVTGGANGIGLAICHELLQHEVKVMDFLSV
jgi:NAD(P)-dependent dehydrogenase (short-subunit alcohol dehydrogenase family)